MGQLTEPQARALEFLVELSGSAGNPRTVMPRQIALAMWPDSPAWNRRNRNNAVGGTMPMKAATLLWKLRAEGYATHSTIDRGWTPTDAGRRAVAAGKNNPLPIEEGPTT